MHILVISSCESLSTLWGKPFPFDGCSAVYAHEPAAAQLAACDMIIDLTFEQNKQRLELYKTIEKPVFVSLVTTTLQSSGISNEPIARFNYWPSFEERSKTEFAFTETQVSYFHSLLKQLHIEYEATADTPGFISARILAMVMNEAFLALEEGVASAQDIDTAMKLGTNYPKGPFEWCDAIGAENVYSLLKTLAQDEPRYTPAPLLKQKAHEQ